MAMLASLVLAAVPLLLVYLYSNLRWRRLKRFSNFPALPTSLVWGHMKAIHEQIQTGGDARRHIDVVFNEFWSTLGHPPFFFVDLWPASLPMLVVCNHEVAEQVTKASKAYPTSVTKSPTMATLANLIGKNSILRADDERWKVLRRRFNPGFAPQHLMTLLPCILDKTALFIDHLDRFVQTGEEFSLDYYATGLTFDIIGAVVLDEDFRAQDSEEHQGEILKLFRQLSAAHTGFNNRIPAWMMPITTYRRRRISKALHRALTELVHRKFAEQRSAAATAAKKSRSVLSLCLQAVDTPAFDPVFVAQTCDQLQTFLFAGHDTTSILLQWSLYELARSPRALAAVRTELDAVLGPGTDPAAISAQLRARGDELLARLPYTSAVIKETLRLHPPAGSARYLEPGAGFYVKEPSGAGGGEQVCLDGLVIYLCATLIQRDESVYGESAGQFVPERWLGDTNTSSSTNFEDGEAAKKTGGIPASAWRPFERGPRNCIGQELANIEARVFLACAVRKYDFVKVGTGEFEVDVDGNPVVGEDGYYKTKSDLFNKMVVTAKPVDGCIMRVKLSPEALAEAA